MHERYGCDGTMQTNRTAAYFEYPSTVAILNREIRYGIEIDFKKVTVRTNSISFVSPLHACLRPREVNRQAPLLERSLVERSLVEPSRSVKR